MVPVDDWWGGNKGGGGGSHSVLEYAPADPCTLLTKEEGTAGQDHLHLEMGYIKGYDMPIYSQGSNIHM